MEVKYQLHAADFMVAQSTSSLWICEGVQRRAFITSLIPWVFIGIGAAATFHGLRHTTDTSNSHVLLIAGAFLLAWITKGLLATRLRNSLVGAYRDHLKPFPIEQTLSISEQELKLSSRLGTSSIAWSAVNKAEQLQTHVALLLASGNVVVVPNDAFESNDARGSALTTIQKYIASSMKFRLS
jgi:hypothetical protein